MGSISHICFPLMKNQPMYWLYHIYTACTNSTLQWGLPCHHLALYKHSIIPYINIHSPSPLYFLLSCIHHHLSNGCNDNTHMEEELITGVEQWRRNWSQVLNNGIIHLCNNVKCLWVQLPDHLPLSTVVVVLSSLHASIHTSRLFHGLLEALYFLIMAVIVLQHIAFIVTVL